VSLQDILYAFVIILIRSISYANVHFYSISFLNIWNILNVPNI